MLGVHRHTLDFDIIQGRNTKTFILADESDYMETPINPVYAILVPGFTSVVSINYIPGQVTVVNSNLLQLSCDPSFTLFFDLPDGLYWITQQIDPADTLYVTKPYLRTSLLEQKYDRLLVRLELSDFSFRRDRDLKDTIIQLDILIQSAKAETRFCNDIKAIEKYRMADRLADKMLQRLKYK